MPVATLAEIYVAAALRVKASLPRALHFLTVSGDRTGTVGATVTINPKGWVVASWAQWGSYSVSDISLLGPRVTAYMVPPSPSASF